MTPRSNIVFKLLGSLTGFSLACLASATGQSAPGFVYETAAEFQTLADVNGDGHPDLVVVDKATGRFRIATGAGDGSLTWRKNAGDSGLGGVTGFSTGPILRPDRDALLFSDTLANRIQVIDTPMDARYANPLRVPANLVGPTLVTAINIPGGEPGFTSALFDIVYHSTVHFSDRPNIVSAFRNATGDLPFTEFGAFESSGIPDRPNRIFLEPGFNAAYGTVKTGASSATFTLYNTAASPMEVITDVNGLPPGTAYVYADFKNNGMAQFVFFKPGSNLIYESAWDGAQLTALTNFSYTAPIDDIRVIESAGQPELLIIFNDGQSAERLAYDGSGKAVPLENFEAPTGSIITGALTAGNRLRLMFGDKSGRSQSLVSYEFNGSAHTRVNEQDLTPLGISNPGASVLLFDSSPLTNPDAVLLSRLNAGPWTSAFTLGGGGPEVVSERYRGSDDGLGDERQIELTGSPPSTGAGLTNQLAPDLSLHFNASAIGEVTSQLSIAPASGTYSRAVRPTLTLAGDAADIFYRTTQQPTWTSYASEPPVFTTDTVIYAVAQDRGLNYSNVVRAEYTFTDEPGEQDSNNDGLPDFVAQAFGLDPLSDETDSDGDGFTDFQEVLGESDPLDPADNPARADVSFEYPNAFDLLAAPGVPDPGGGTTLLRSFAEGASAPATEMTVHQPNGFYLGSAATQAWLPLPDPAARFGALDVVNSDLFLIAATETNFPVNDGSAKDYGRQVAAAVTIPKQRFEPFAYDDFGTHGGYGDLAAEAEAWRNAAFDYYNGLERETVTLGSVGPESTLGLLLIEKILGDKLLAGGLTDRANISLTPFRDNENPLAPDATEETPSGRNRAVSLDELLALQRSSGASIPSYEIREVVATVTDAIATASEPHVPQLVELANQLYLASATNTEAGSLRQPFDALRQFIQKGNLDLTGYEDPPTAANFPASLLADAAQGISEIEALIPGRTMKTVALYYEGEPAGDCQAWQEVVYRPASFDPDAPVLFGRKYALMDDQGRPFPVARAFPLTPGSVFEVKGFVEGETPCGAVALEVIPQPELVFLHNASPADLDGNLLADSLEGLLADTTLSAFGDTDGDGYSDLQETLSGSDPTSEIHVPASERGSAPIVDLTPPQVNIESNGPESATVSFDYPADFAPYLQFELYSSSDLQTFMPTGQHAVAVSGSHHELNLSTSAEKKFYIFRMSLK